MKIVLIAGAALAGAACAAEPARFSEYRFDPDREHVGRIYHYLRSNRDGSSPEQIHVFHKSSTDVEVYKMVQRCTNAALVTAALDYDRWSASRLVGGRLNREAAQDAFAVLTFDPGVLRLDAVVTLPDQEIRQTLDLQALPWRLYDFDFAEFTIFAQHLRDPRQDFSVEMAMVSTNPDDGNFLKRLGAMKATAMGPDEARGVYRFALGGEAFAAGGALTLDARDGHVVEVETAVPNHDGYDDFKLVLQSVDDGGAPAWRKLLLSHFEGCAEAN